MRDHNITVSRQASVRNCAKTVAAALGGKRTFVQGSFRALAPVSEALARLEPVAPEAPQLLLPRDELDVAYEIADLLQGAVPHWHVGRREIAEPVEPDDSPLGPDFERLLENAKRAASGLPPLADDCAPDDRGADEDR